MKLYQKFALIIIGLFFGAVISHSAYIRELRATETAYKDTLSSVMSKGRLERKLLIDSFGDVIDSLKFNNILLPRIKP